MREMGLEMKTIALQNVKPSFGKTRPEGTATPNVDGHLTC
jgi:hypothetical protein